jgi:phosphatidylglycerol lysyltransferase
LEAYLGPIFIEFSHAFSAVIGMALMIISNFLWRESRFAFFIATFLLALGVINALFKGLSYEIAAVTGLALVLMVAFEGEFLRKFGRGGFSISYRFLAAIIGSMASIAWMSYFAFSDVKFTFEMLFDTGVHAHAARAIRALIAAGGTFIIGTLILWLMGEEAEELEADFD